MDNTHIVLIHLKLEADKFEKYYCEKKMFVGINMLKLHMLIKTITNNDILSLFILKNDPNTLGITIENIEKNVKTTYKLSMLDIDVLNVEIPPVAFNTIISMPSIYLQKIIRDMHNIAEFIEKLKLDSVNIVGKSDGGIIGILLGIYFPEHIKKIIAFGANMQPDTTALYAESVKEIHDEIDTYLTGAEHQHTSYISMFRYSQNGDMKHGVIITPLDDKLKKDAHLPNSQNATGKVLEAFGLTPQLTGSTMSNALSQGGGSDIRESWNVVVSSIYSDQQAILFPMKVYLQQHGLPSECIIRVKNIIQNTLDKTKTGTQSAF
jgi:hypothetical protein